MMWLTSSLKKISQIKISNDNVNMVLLFWTLLLGAFLRVWILMNHSFWPWYDELYTIYYVINSSSPLEIYKTYFSMHETNPILHSTLLLYYTELFGTTILAFKSFSAICGILVLVSVYHIVKKLLTLEHAIICVACIALSRFPIYLSQESRPYMLYFLGSIWFFYYLYRIYKGEDLTRSLLIKFYVATFVFANSHFIGLIIAALMFGFILLRLKTSNKKKLGLLLVFILINIFSIAQVANIVVNSYIGQSAPASLAWMEKHSLKTRSFMFPVNLFIDLFLRGAGNGPVIRYNSWLQYCYAGLMFLFASLGFLLERKDRKTKLLKFTIIYALFSFCFLWMISMLSALNVVAKIKIFIYLLFPTSIIISVGVYNLSSKITRFVSKPVVISFFILISFLFVTNRFMKEDQSTYYGTVDMESLLTFISNSTKHHAELYVSCDITFCKLPSRFMYTYRNLVLQKKKNIKILTDLEEARARKLFILKCTELPEEALTPLKSYNMTNTFEFTPCELITYSVKK